MLIPLWDSHRCLQSSCGWSVTYGSSTIKSWLSGMLKNWYFWAVALEKTLDKSPLDWKEIKSVNPKGNQSWIFIRRTDAEAAAPILWQPDAKNWLIGNDPDTGKDWRQEEKGATENKMTGWYHWLNGHELSKFLEIVKDKEAWYAAVHGVTKSQTWPSDWTTTPFVVLLPQLKTTLDGEDGTWQKQ